MKPLGMRHVALYVKDAQLSKAFYRDFFEMTVEWEPDPLNVFLTTSGQDNLALHEDKIKVMDMKNQALDHLGFIYRTKEDVDKMRQKATEMNVKIAKEIKLHRDGAYSFYVYDCDGYTVQVMYHPPISLYQEK